MSLLCSCIPHQVCSYLLFTLTAMGGCCCPWILHTRTRNTRSSWWSCSASSCASPTVQQKNSEHQHTRLSLEELYIHIVEQENFIGFTAQSKLSLETAKGTEKLWSLQTSSFLTQVNYSEKCTFGCLQDCKGGLFRTGSTVSGEKGKSMLPLKQNNHLSSMWLLEQIKRTAKLKNSLA